MSVADVNFTRGPARRPAVTVSDPLLQWASGLTTNKRSIYAGWMCEAGKDEELDTAFHGAGYETVQIKHGNGKLVTHWAVETANAYVCADGIQSIGEMKTTPERYGVAFGWRTLPDGRPQSALKVRVYIKELLEVGFEHPLTITVKSTVTGDVLKALIRHYDALDAVTGFQRQAGKPEQALPFYAIACPIGPSAEEQKRGGDLSKQIIVPVCYWPEVGKFNRSELADKYIHKDWVPAVERTTNESLRWSVMTSAQIESGEDQQARDGAAVHEERAEYAA